ncbi:MAG: antitoxin VapB family protein [Haloarculaceae archaeon]
MGTRSVRLDERVYEFIESHKREDETFSEAIERLVRGPPLSELAGLLSEEDAEAFRSVVDDIDSIDEADTDELVERFPDEN